MHRRNFILLATGGMATASLPATTASADLRTHPVGPAVIRTGRRLLAALPRERLDELRHLAASLPAAPGPDLQARISADHRAGRTIRLDGISLSVTEACWCLTAAQGREFS